MATHADLNRIIGRKVALDTGVVPKWAPVSPTDLVSSGSRGVSSATSPIFSSTSIARLDGSNCLAEKPHRNRLAPKVGSYHDKRAGKHAVSPVPNVYGDEYDKMHARLARYAARPYAGSRAKRAPPFSIGHDPLPSVAVEHGLEVDSELRFGVLSATLPATLASRLPQPTSQDEGVGLVPQVNTEDRRRPQSAGPSPFRSLGQEEGHEPDNLPQRGLEASPPPQRPLRRRPQPAVVASVGPQPPDASSQPECVASAGPRRPAIMPTRRRPQSANAACGRSRVPDASLQAQSCVAAAEPEKPAIPRVRRRPQSAIAASGRSRGLEASPQAESCAEAVEPEKLAIPPKRRRPLSAGAAIGRVPKTYPERQEWEDLIVRYEEAFGELRRTTRMTPESPARAFSAKSSGDDEAGKRSLARNRLPGPRSLKPGRMPDAVLQSALLAVKCKSFSGTVRKAKAVYERKRAERREEAERGRKEAERSGGLRRAQYVKGTPGVLGKAMKWRSDRSTSGQRQPTLAIARFEAW